MFDFQKLEVYKKAKAFCTKITQLIAKEKFDKTTLINCDGLHLALC